MNFSDIKKISIDLIEKYKNEMLLLQDGGIKYYRSEGHGELKDITEDLIKEKKYLISVSQELIDFIDSNDMA
jgi:hypothetical protein